MSSILKTAKNRISSISSQLSSTTTRTMASYHGTKLRLNTGAEIPAIGFGTWQDKDAQEAAVLSALKDGYRHIYTSRM